MGHNYRIAGEMMQQGDTVLGAGGACHHGIGDPMHTARGGGNGAARVDQLIQGFVFDDAPVQHPHGAQLNDVILMRQKPGGFGVKHHKGQLPKRAMIEGRGGIGGDQGKIIGDGAHRIGAELGMGVIDHQHIALRRIQRFHARIKAELPMHALRLQCHLFAGFGHCAIGLLQGLRLEVIKQRGIQPWRRHLRQRLGCLAIVEHDLMVGIGHDHGHGNLGQQADQPIFFGLQRGGFGRDLGGAFQHCLAQLLANRLCRWRQIAQIPRAVAINARAIWPGRADPQASRQTLDRFGDVFIKQQPNARGQGRQAKACHNRA